MKAIFAYAAATQEVNNTPCAPNQCANYQAV